MKRGAMFRSTTKDNQETTFKRLLLALELARARFAVAIAAEKKSTSLPQWQYYLDTADQVRRCLKRLRKRDDGSGEMQHDWVGFLEALNRLPGGEGASMLSRMLGDIVVNLAHVSHR